MTINRTLFDIPSYIVNTTGMEYFIVGLDLDVELLHLLAEGEQFLLFLLITDINLPLSLLGRFSVGIQDKLKSK